MQGNDGWGHVKYAQTMQDRLSASNDWIRSVGAKVPYYCDTMADTARLVYQAWPERLYIIEDGKIVYKGGPGPFQYDVSEVARWLEKRFSGKR